MVERGLLKKRTILYGFLALLVILAVGFLIWAETPLGPMPEALAALQSDGQATVRQVGEWTVFDPTGFSPDLGVIIYPGGRVDWRAYAPEAHAIAAQGYRVVIVPMPLNLAVFGSDRADRVMAALPDTRRWVVGGHSLGGAMAAQYAADKAGQSTSSPAALGGVFFWASYPNKDASLAALPLQVVSVYATNDGLATASLVEASRPMLPPTAILVVIEGGNHAGFGWYGAQPGDHPATIDRSAQQDQVVAAMVNFLRSVGQ
jgi:pimeloyl-ACP methyl ester carboxylesterase